MPNYTYDNKLVANKFNSILETEVNLSQFLTLDDTLTAGAGDTKRVVYRSVSGSVDDLAMGESNTNSIAVTGGYTDYTLKTTQGKGSYFDEEAQKDALIVDTMLKGIAETMTNNWNSKIFAEYGKAIYNEVGATINFDGFVDAIAKFKESDKDLFALCHPSTVATLRKALATSLQYSEGFARTGYIGSVCGVPVYMTSAAPAGEVIIASKEAVTAFVNKQLEVEYDRDADKRENTYFIRTVALVALTNEKKVCRLAAAATTATTITTYTKAAKTVAGAATTGATVEVYINGVLDKTTTAASSAYSVTCTNNLAAGDIVKVIARKEGQVSSTATATVAE